MKAFGRRFDFLLHQLSLPWFCHRFGIPIAAATGILGTVSFSPLYAQEFKPFDQFLNISTRVLVGSGDNVAIAGFIVIGSEAKNVIIRAMGPSLTGAGISNALQDPMLELHDSSGALITSNDNWKDTQQAEIQASGLAPADDRESAIVRTLSPGAYTAIVRGKDGTGGIGLIEGYDLDSSADSIFANISTRGFVGTGDNAMIGGLIVILGIGIPSSWCRTLRHCTAPGLLSLLEAASPDCAPKISSRGRATIPGHFFPTFLGQRRRATSVAGPDPRAARSKRCPDRFQR